MEYPFKDLLPLDEVLEREGYYKDWTHLDPEVFYSLTQISEYIKTKGYGVDVRLLIAQLAEHFGLKTTQVVDLANLLQQQFTNLEGVTQSFTNNINSLVAQMEADKDAVIANATVDSEVILARGGKATLGERLDETTAQLAQMAKLNGQTDFVDFVLRHKQPFYNMSFLKTGSNDYQIWLSNDEKGIIYAFVKDNNDDFIKLNAGFSGLDKQGGSFVSKHTVDEADLTGTFLSSGISRYTTTIGDKFTLKATGEKLVLTINSEARGGAWSVKVDDNPPVIVSCYSETTLEKDIVIAGGLPNIEHTVVGTFIGDDPNNPPSASPSRGYLRAVNLANKGTLTGYKGNGVNTAEKIILATASNKEFAFTVRKNGTHNWVPEHDAKGSAFNISAPQFIVDGQAIDTTSMTIGSSGAIPIKESFELKQHFNGHVVGQAPVMEVKTSHKINLEGKLSFSGHLTALTNFEVAAGYPMMLPAQNEVMNEFISGIYNSKVNDSSENHDFFEAERDMVNSGAIISSLNKNLIGAGTLRNPIKTYRLGSNGKPPIGESLFLWNRTTKPKMYWMSMQDNQFNVGDQYFWSFDFAIAEIEGVYDIIKNG